MKQDLSLFNTILIALEHFENSQLSHLKKFGPSRRVIGSIGRLEGLGLIRRHKDNGQLTYQLSNSGDEYLATQLQFLPPQKKWDKLWRIFFLVLDERHRHDRIQIYSKLRNWGVTQIGPGLWATPSKRTADSIRGLMAREHKKIPSLFFEGELKHPDYLLTRNKQVMNILGLRYKKLFFDLEQFFLNLSHFEDKSFTAKCHLFRLSLITTHDINLTTKLQADWIGYESIKWCKKLRRIIATKLYLT